MSFTYMTAASLVQSITADKEQAGFPATYTLTDHPRQGWKSTDGTGTLTLQVAARSTALFIAGTNAESISIEIRSADGQAILVPGQSFDMLGVTTLEEFMTGEALAAQTTLWYVYPQPIAEQSQVVITYTKSFADAVPVASGICHIQRAWKTAQSINKEYDDSYTDYSAVNEKQFNNGTAYIYQRGTARYVRCLILGTRMEIETHLKRIRNYIGSRPFPVKLIDIDGLPGEFVFYARQTDTPKRKVFSVQRAQLELTLKERL